LELQRFDVQDLAEFDRAFSEMTAWRADGLIVLAADLFARHRPRLAELAAQHGLPSMYSSKEFAQAGGLVAYGPSVSDASRRAASYVDKILKGARPADLPVEQPREFDLVINLRTAQALGITIPRHVLLQATEVIQ
jgi:putative ABC transport system substrate-binding protein